MENPRLLSLCKKKHISLQILQFEQIEKLGNTRTAHVPPFCSVMSKPVMLKEKLIWHKICAILFQNFHSKNVSVRYKVVAQSATYDRDAFRNA
jgi:hypothetical protein